jgi:cytochrome c oxidase assembly protein subunit 11
MAGPAKHDDKRKMRGNLIAAAACLTFVGAMVGVTYASVPLYKLFCQVTGFGGATRQVDEASQKILTRMITVRFDANVSPALPWEFQPDQRDVTMRIGETTEIAYTAKNMFKTPTRGKATFNVVPELAGAYFNKLECFCFTDTTLNPGQSLDMPVVFFVDPEIVNEPDLKDIKTITLSYTFFPSTDETPVASAAPVKDKKAEGQLQ